jgi:hypothetical protein
LGISILSGLFMLPAMIPAMAMPIMMESGVDFSGQAVMLTMLVFACLFFPLMSLFSGVTGAFMTSVLELSYLRLTRTADAEIVFASEAPKDATS